MNVKTPAVSVNGVTASYGRKRVLHGISFIADPGDQVAVIGRNGCGKSTLLQVLSGIHPAESGVIAYYGTSASDDHGVFSRYCGYLPQKDPLMEAINVQDNISLFSGKSGKPEAWLVEEFDLGSILKERVSSLSGGMKRRVAIACAVVHRPSVIIMDEPTSSLDIYYRKELRGWMKGFRERGGITILATHDDTEISESSLVIEIDKGIQVN